MNYLPYLVMVFLEDFSSSEKNNELLESLDVYDGIVLLCNEYNKYYCLGLETCYLSTRIKTEFLKFIKQGHEEYLRELEGLRKIFRNATLFNSLKEKEQVRQKTNTNQTGFKKKGTKLKDDILNKQPIQNNTNETNQV